MSQLNDNVIVTEVEILPYRLEAEWREEDPIIGNQYGAYSSDTYLLRVGDGIKKWSELTAIRPASYVGPHAHLHLPGGSDPIDVSKLVVNSFAYVAYGNGGISSNENSDTQLTYEARLESELINKINDKFIYIGAPERTIMVEVHQRYVREDTNDTALMTAYNVTTSIVSSRANPQEKVEDYATMNIGLPWCDTVVKKIMRVQTNDEISVMFSSGLPTRTFDSSDDPNTDISSVSYIYIYSID